MNYPEPTSHAASVAMKGNTRRDTRPELAVRRALHARGLRYRVDLRVTAGEVRVRPDITFPRDRIALFIDGCFWHGCPAHARNPKSNVGYWSAKILKNVKRDERANTR